MPTQDHVGKKHVILGLTQLIAPISRREWVEAMTHELASIERPLEGIKFATGMILTALHLRFQTDKSRLIAGRISLYCLCVWALIKMYFTSIVLNPNLPFNFFTSEDPSFTPSDLLLPSQYIIIYTIAILYLLAGMLLTGRHVKLALNFVLIAFGLISLELILTIITLSHDSVQYGIFTTLYVIEVTIIALIIFGLNIIKGRSNCL